MSVAAMPSKLNCAGIGAKNLAKKRLLGLLLMLKTVNLVGDRVGEEEYYEELERNYQAMQSQKHIGSSNKKALRVCLLPLLSFVGVRCGRKPFWMVMDELLRSRAPGGLE